MNELITTAQISFIHVKIHMEKGLAIEKSSSISPNNKFPSCGDAQLLYHQSPVLVRHLSLRKPTNDLLFPFCFARKILVMPMHLLVSCNHSQLPSKGYL